MDGCGKSLSCRDSIPEPSTTKPVLRPLCCHGRLIKRMAPKSSWARERDVDKRGMLQLDARFFFRIHLFQFSTCFEHPCAHHQKNQLYRVIQKDGLNFVRISWTIHGIWMIYITLERGGPKFSNTTTRALAWRTAVQQRQLRAKWLLCSTTNFCLILIESNFFNHAVLIRRLVYVSLKTNEWTNITKSIS